MTAEDNERELERLLEQIPDGPEPFPFWAKAIVLAILSIVILIVNR